jgi:sulfoxide reductase catalytic subunit YedY
MTVPWLGVPVKKIIEKAQPKSGAKYVQFKTFFDPKQAPGQAQLTRYPWPYFEGLRLDEAMNELTLFATGMYGRRLPEQSGTPLRLIIPWKYGFKGPKSVVQMTFLDSQPSTFWNTLQPAEYKFFSNVDPKVPHPRWSQATEWWLGDRVTRHDTQWYNGYGKYVAEMYEGIPRTLY